EISLATRVQAQDGIINSSVRRCPEMRGQIHPLLCNEICDIALSRRRRFHRDKKADKDIRK
ncbi:hypothetical protein, partial [Ralstonia edaphi]|uniref:hypothetical protein n=1 Tax=Ralstonia edaphi TaxID=3058599 RepID=UPI002931CACC